MYNRVLLTQTYSSLQGLEVNIKLHFLDFLDMKNLGKARSGSRPRLLCFSLWTLKTSFFGTFLHFLYKMFRVFSRFSVGPALVGVSATAVFSTYANTHTFNAPKIKTQPVLETPAHAVQGEYDVAIVGGGIVGLATAREILLRFPEKTVTVLEKETEVASHQTGHNSGVIHAGIYYAEGSTMARCCVKGADYIYQYAERYGLPAEKNGKLICAPTEKDAPVLATLLERGTNNGVKGLEIVDSEWIKKREPAVDVHSALYSPNTGSADYGAIARHYAKEINESGRGRVQVQFEVDSIKYINEANEVEIRGKEPKTMGLPKVVRAKHVITCAGLQSDRVAQLADGAPKPQVLTFRGTYYQMKPEYRNITSMNIYPVPSGGGIPVGVHFTPTVNERRGRQMIVGPGACVAFGREAYSFFDYTLKDLWAMATHIGLWKFAFSNFDLAITEMYRDLNRNAFMNQARKLIPTVTDDMVEESFAGVMAQVFHDDGKAAKDFILERKVLNGTTLHVRSAPTPACTASLAIAEEVVEYAAEDFEWGKGKKKRRKHSPFYD